MRNLALAASALALILPAAADQTLEGVSAGLYELEPTHAFLTWGVGHAGGISTYTVNFTDYDADLIFDPEDPIASRISVTINPTALQTNYPDPVKKAEWENELANDAKFFNAGEFPEITFVSTSAEKTGEFTGTVTGDLTFLGMTKPVTMDVTYNGMANMPWYGQRDLIGFDASTTIKRSEFGLTAMIPNISDEVEINFSGEFLQAE
ncbi:MAG: YceI family protein [Pseudomonadota bacterium]